MTKEQFKQYINEAIDALDDAELEQLFPAANQPDLYTLMAEFTGIKGELKKMAQASLKASAGLETAMVQNAGRWDQLQQLLSPQEEEQQETTTEISNDLKTILFQIIDQNDLLTSAHRNLQTIDSPHWIRLATFKKQWSSWLAGFELTMDRWNKFVKSTGLYQTGTSGQLFDPVFHEAVAVKTDPSKPDNQILEAEQVGYLFRNRLVRQAKVIVNKTNSEMPLKEWNKPAKKRNKKKLKLKKRK